MKHLAVQSAGSTDVGMIREDNQDQFFVAELTRSMSVKCGSLAVEPNARLFGGSLGWLYLVADGMGGHRAGSEASKLAIHYFINAILNSMRWLVQIAPDNDEAFEEDLQRMLTSAHREMESQSNAEFSLQGMGTTLTMAYVAWPRMFVVHAGDTRCYVMRQGELRLITRDHTVANQLIESGQLDPEQLERSPWSNVLVNALGAGAPEVIADIYKVELLTDDRIVLCSDGLNKHVDDHQIQQVVANASSPQAACDQLVDLARRGGGSDNITVVIAHFEELEDRTARMQIIASRPSEERIINELSFPEEEIDTHCDEPNSGASDEYETNGDPTLPFEQPAKPSFFREVPDTQPIDPIR